ncbi:MAG: RNA polymerase sigma factor [Clostridia bacterium]|nr:RNA polymerase sigma factor [Clostridia bacterium]
MKKVELKARFNSFYNTTYPQAMAYCMAKTGDFVNSEDLLADSYYAIYKRFLKDKNDEIQEPEKYLYTVLKNRIAKYWKKHSKELQVSVSSDDDSLFESVLETEFDLTAETAIKQMLVQDILEYVSSQPAPMRRAFAMHFYLGMTIDETAAELKVPVTTARNYIYRMLQRVKDNFLEDYE